MSVSGVFNTVIYHFHISNFLYLVFFFFGNLFGYFLSSCDVLLSCFFSLILDWDLQYRMSGITDHLAGGPKWSLSHRVEGVHLVVKRLG